MKVKSLVVVLAAEVEQNCILVRLPNGIERPENTVQRPESIVDFDAQIPIQLFLTLVLFDFHIFKLVKCAYHI